MQIVTSIEKINDLKNMLVEEVVGRLRVHEERLCGYEDRDEEKHVLLTHEELLAWTKKKDVVDSSFSGTKGHDDHKKESKGCGHGRKRGNRGAVKIPHKPKSPRPQRGILTTKLQPLQYLVPMLISS